MASGGWSTADTVQTVAAGAQVVAAGFTLTLALMTKGLATKTKQMAEATKNMADETRRVADSSAVEAEATKALVVEAQKDRALSWSPYLSRVVLSDIANASGEPLGLNQVITSFKPWEGAGSPVYLRRLRDLVISNCGVSPAPRVES